MKTGNTWPFSREMAVNGDWPQDDPDNGFNRKGFKTIVTIFKDIQETMLIVHEQIGNLGWEI